MRCIFPERTGALLRFLEAVGSEWNISLFHYRNHGADYGRILAGVQVPPAQRARFRTKLDELGYEWSDETDNPAYLLFLHKEGIGDPAVARAACAPSARAHVGDEI